MKVFEKVSGDKYEIPLAIADTEKELADVLGVTLSAVSRGIRAYMKGEKSRYRVVDIEEAVPESPPPVKRRRTQRPRKRKPPVIIPEEPPKKDEWSKVIRCFKAL